MNPDPDLDPAIFVSDLQDVNKNFFANYFLKVHFHHFSKIKSHKEVTKLKEAMFFYYFCLMIDMDADPYLSLMDPGADPGGPKKYGSYGSGSATPLRSLRSPGRNSG
jgi:hypothetical protein